MTGLVQELCDCPRPRKKRESVCNRDFRTGLDAEQRTDLRELPEQLVLVEMFGRRRSSLRDAFSVGTSLNPIIDFQEIPK